LSISADNLLLVQLTDWINENAQEIGLPAELEIDQGDAHGEALWLQPLAGTVKAVTYTDGGYVGELPFAIYYQLPKRDSDSLGAAALASPLWKIANFFEGNSLSAKVTGAQRALMTSSPSAFLRTDSVSCYQAVYKLVYGKGIG
jgi:hypothetical protein